MSHLETIIIPTKFSSIYLSVTDPVEQHMFV